jgi:hypothetical protein
MPARAELVTHAKVASFRRRQINPPTPKTTKEIVDDSRVGRMVTANWFDVESRSCWKTAYHLPKHFNWSRTAGRLTKLAFEKVP